MSRGGPAMAFTRGATAIILLLAAGSAAGRTAPRSDPDAGAQQFAKAYVSALRSHDPARLQALQHPASRACLNDQTRAYFDWGIANEFKTGAMLSGPYTITRFGPIGGESVLGFLPRDSFAYPVKPTHQIQIDFESRDNQGILLVRELARENGRWFMVDPCPNAAGLKFFAEQKALGDRQRTESLRLLAAMPAPLRQELTGVLAQGRFIDAAHRYQAATGADLTTAVGVVEQLRDPG